MFRFCCRRLQFLVPSTISVDSSLNQFQKASPFITSLLGSQKLDTNPDDGNHQSFTVSYFINSLGFSPQVALSLSNKRGVHFKSPKQPDSVIKLLKDYGFSDTHVSKIVNKRPDLLLFYAQETLKPKLQFFASIGFTGTALADIIAGNPKVLTLSLEENLRPCYDVIRTLPISYKKVGRVVSKLYQGFTVSPPLLSNIAPNIAFLREVQVPESSINLCLNYNLFTVLRETNKFKEHVERVMSMGISPSSAPFMKALYVISATNKLKWVQRMEFYVTTFGWTEDDFLLAFRKNPMFMGVSEEKNLSKIDFFVKRMGWEPAFVAASPGALNYSLEKWIIPRCSVIRVLLLKGLIMKGDYSLGCMVTTCKNYFLDRFVIRYQKQVPELLNIFQGKMKLADVGLGFEETD